MVPYSKMSSKGRFELQINASGAKFARNVLETTIFLKKITKNCEKVKVRSTFPKWFQCFQMNPNASRSIRTSPGRSKQVRKYQKTEVPSKIKNLLHEFEAEMDQEEENEIQRLRQKGDSVGSGIYNGQSMVTTGGGRKKK